MRLSILVVLLVLVGWKASFAQGTKADYERARELPAKSRDKVFRDSVQAHWIEGGKAFWYRVRTGRAAFRWYVVDARSGERRPAFDHAKVASALQAAGVTEATEENLPLEKLAVDRAQDRVTFQAGGRNWEWRLKHDALGPLETLPSPQMRQGASPERGPRGSGETSITFLNQTKGPIELFWISGEDRRSYGKVSPGAEHRQHTFAGHRWLVTDDKGNELGTTVGQDAPRTVEVPSDLRPRREPGRSRSEGRPSWSPDGNWRIAVRDHNLFVVDARTGSESPLTTDGSEEDAYGNGIFWSPDSRFVVAMKTRPAEKHEVHIVQSSPPDQVQPKLISFDYLKPEIVWKLRSRACSGSRIGGRWSWTSRCIPTLTSSGTFDGQMIPPGSRLSTTNGDTRYSGSCPSMRRRERLRRS